MWRFFVSVGFRIHLFIMVLHLTELVYVLEEKKVIESFPLKLYQKLFSTTTNGRTLCQNEILHEQGEAKKAYKQTQL